MRANDFFYGWPDAEAIAQAEAEVEAEAAAAACASLSAQDWWDAALAGRITVPDGIDHYINGLLDGKENREVSESCLEAIRRSVEELVHLKCIEIMKGQKND